MPYAGFYRRMVEQEKCGEVREVPPEPEQKPEAEAKPELPDLDPNKPLDIQPGEIRDPVGYEAAKAAGRIAELPPETETT